MKATPLAALWCAAAARSLTLKSVMQPAALPSCRRYPYVHGMGHIGDGVSV